MNWQLVLREQPDLGRRFLDVMCEMDSHYQHLEWSDVFPLMTSDGWEYYVGAATDCEVVIGYQWDADRNKYQVRSSGFRGRLEPHDALAIMAAHVREFLAAHDAQAVFLIVPRMMDNPRMMQLLGLIPWYPGWRVTGGHHLSGGTYWKIEPPVETEELQQQSSH